ncbi:hypothetical protein KY284_015917 [Solanum tuberosum]|nr:hypothetical protein KY284_015917 [Solanum tuberosum]
MNNDSGARQVIFELCLSENVKNKLTRFVHIVALSSGLDFAGGGDSDGCGSISPASRATERG